MLRLAQIKAMMSQKKFFCWALYLVQGGKPLPIGDYPAEEDEGGEVDPHASESLLDDLVGSYAEDGGVVKFMIDLKKSPKSNQGGRSNGIRFQVGEGSGFSGLGGFGGGNTGLGMIGQLMPLFQQNTQNQRELIEVISERNLLKYKNEQLEKEREEFQKEKKAWHEEHRELKAKWEDAKTAMKEGIGENLPDAIKGLFGAVRGDKAPEVKPLAGTDKKDEEAPAPTSEEQIILELADYLNEHVKNIYALRQISAAIHSPNVSQLASYVVTEIPDEDTRAKVTASVKKMIINLKQGS